MPARGGVTDLILTRPMKHAIPLLLAALIVRSSFAADNPFEAGLAALKEGNVDKAISLFTEDIRLHPRNGAAYDNRRFAYLQKGDLDRAIADYSRAIQLDPNRAEDYNNRGAIFGSQRQWDKAIADFNAAIQKNPRFAEAYVNRGIAYYGKREVAKASRTSKKLSGSSPETQKPHYVCR
jgi:tetratricopeptide (TPR) repeat protein